MSISPTVLRVCRETVTSYGDAGVMQQEIEESALATMQVEVNAGRYNVDVERALRAEIREAIKADGRAADGIIRRMARGDVPITTDDLDVIVILGGGLRKSWGAVTPADLATMNEIRYKNYRAARDSFQEFNANIMAVTDMLGNHKTVAEAYEAGAFEAEEAVA